MEGLFLVVVPVIAEAAQTHFGDGRQRLDAKILGDIIRRLQCVVHQVLHQQDAAAEHGTQQSAQSRVLCVAGAVFLGGHHGILHQIGCFGLHDLGQIDAGLLDQLVRDVRRPLRVGVRDRDGQDAGAAGVADADLLFQLAICNVKVEVLDDVLQQRAAEHQLLIVCRQLGADLQVGQVDDRIVGGRHHIDAGRCLILRRHKEEGEAEG